MCYVLLSLSKKHSEWFIKRIHQPIGFWCFEIYAIVKKLLFQLVVRSICLKESLRDVPWNQLKSENTETLYFLSALKEPEQIDYKKASSILEQAWISRFCWHICSEHCSLSILPEIHKKTQRSPNVFRGRKRSV